MKYDGPLVLANQMMLKLQMGGWGLPAPCFFCPEKSFVDILGHLTSVHEARIGKLFSEDEKKDDSMTFDRFKMQLISRAWFRFENFPSWWSKQGVLMPRKLADTVTDPSEMIFCSFCLAPVLKSSWDVHCTTCRPILGRTEKPTLRSNRLHLWEM